MKTLVKSLVFLLCINSLAYGMKRPAEEEPIREEEVPFSEGFDFLNLPSEIQAHILDQLLIGKGPTNQARLYNAIEKVRNFLDASKATAGWTDYIITQLANRYTHRNKIKVAVVLGNYAAGQWFRSIVYTEEMFVLGEKEFLQAAENGDIDIIRFMLVYAPNPIFLPTGKAILKAAQNNHELIVKALLQLPGEDASLFNKSIPETDYRITMGQLALNYAIDNNNFDIASMLLDFGVDPNFELITGDPVIDYGDITPIQYAIAKGNLKLITKLLEKGATLFTTKEDKNFIIERIRDLPEGPSKTAIVKILSAKLQSKQ